MGSRSIRRNMTKNLSQNELNERARKHGYEAGFRKGIEEGMHVMGEVIYIMTAYTLEYKLELEQDELAQIMIWIYNNIDAYRTNHLSREDFIQIKKDMESKGIIYD